MDSESSLHETYENPLMKNNFPHPAEPLGQWARKFIPFATAHFGENSFPDGRGINFIVEDNVACQNAVKAGAAFNFSALQYSLVQNNLAYDNKAHGMTFYCQYDPFDKEIITTGFSSPAEITGPAALPMFGSHDNIVRNNTILVNIKGRGAAMFIGGSYNCTVRNNIFINDADDSVHIDSFSLWHHDSDHNVIGREGFSKVNPEGFWAATARRFQSRCRWSLNRWRRAWMRATTRLPGKPAPVFPGNGARQR